MNLDWELLCFMVFEMFVRLLSTVTLKIRYLTCWTTCTFCPFTLRGERTGSGSSRQKGDSMWGNQTLQQLWALIGRRHRVPVLSDQNIKLRLPLTKAGHEGTGWIWPTFRRSGQNLAETAWIQGSIPGRVSGFRLTESNHRRFLLECWSWQCASLYGLSLPMISNYSRAAAINRSIGWDEIISFCMWLSGVTGCFIRSTKHWKSGAGAPTFLLVWVVCSPWSLSKTVARLALSQSSVERGPDQKTGPLRILHPWCQSWPHTEAAALHLCWSPANKLNYSDLGCSSMASCWMCSQCPAAPGMFLPFRGLILCPSRSNGDEAGGAGRDSIVVRK